MMRPIIVLLTFVAFGLAAATLPAQDEPAESGGDAAEQAQSSGEGQAPAGNESGESGADEEIGAAEARESADNEGFVPTEELDADEEVTFPVDI